MVKQRLTLIPCIRKLEDGTRTMSYKTFDEYASDAGLEVYGNVQGSHKIRVHLSGEDHWHRDPIPLTKLTFPNDKEYNIQATSDFHLQACIRLILMREALQDDVYFPPYTWDELESWGYEIPWKTWLNTKSEEWFYGKEGAKNVFYRHNKGFEQHPRLTGGGFRVVDREDVKPKEPSNFTEQMALMGHLGRNKRDEIMFSGLKKGFLSASRG